MLLSVTNRFTVNRRISAGFTSSETKGFTLVELLVVIAIIALLAAIIFPVFATAQGKARQITCVSNLRQIGTAIQMYASDYDGYMPYAKDASDAWVPQIWPALCVAKLKEMPFIHPYTVTGKAGGQKLPGAIDPYIKNQDIWKCAGDTGYDTLDNNDSCNGPCYMYARPTMFQAFGASYLYRTEISFRHLNVDSVTAKDFNGNDVGPAGINVLFDGNGSWHGQPFALGRSGLRYVTLLADGHAKLLTNEQYQIAWSTQINDVQSRGASEFCK